MHFVVAGILGMFRLSSTLQITLIILLDGEHSQRLNVFGLKVPE